MSATPTLENGKIDAWPKEAAAIARQFLMTFNGAMLYGSTHPNTAKNAVALSDIINASFGGRDLITIISNNGTFMIEDWQLDGSFNMRKLFQHFEKLNLISVSFERGVDPDSIARLVQLAGDIRNVDACRAALHEVKTAGSIPRVRINYVLYGKIMADEVVVKEGAAPLAAAPSAGLTGTSNIATGNLSLAAAAQIEEVLTLSSLIERPKEVSELLAQAGGAREEGELHQALGRMKSEMDAPETRSAGELLESLYGLKRDLYEAIQVQQATGRVMRSAAAINNEINDLTSRAIVKLVKDEYGSGKMPLNRLAYTIRRMLPANAELMQVLPPLKEMLLAEGMALGDYLELVRMLGVRVESESLTDSLRDAAESMGASVDDLVAAIKSKPEEAARLILLASEIRRGAGQEESGLSDLLTGYIENVCTQIAADTCGASGARDGNTLKKVLAQLESQMYNQLAGQGVDGSVLQDVRQQLAERFNDTCAAVSGSLTASSPSPAGAEKFKLPAEALNINSLLFIINKEIKRHLRYNSQFSTITVSMEKLIQGGGARLLKPEDIAELLPQLFTTVEALLRDVDLIGAIGAENNPELFILLPMTGEEGTAIVRERIIKTANETTFTVMNRPVNITVKVSTTLPSEKTADLKSYMAQTRINHKNER